MSRNYETVIIFSPLLGEEDVKRAVKKYKKLLQDQDAKIVEERNWGLKQLAYSINGKSNGIYYIMEFATDNHSIIGKLEVEYKRDEENIIRFLTVALDKYGMEYNEKRRQGLVGKNKKVTEHQNQEA